jgi:hypothetical protein
MDLTMDAEDAELVVETAAAPAATTVDQVNVPDSEILDCELTVTSPAAVNNTYVAISPPVNCAHTELLSEWIGLSNCS